MMMHANSICKSFSKKGLLLQTRPLTIPIKKPYSSFHKKATPKNPPPPPPKKSLFSSPKVLSSLANTPVFIRSMASDITRGEVKTYFSSALKSLSLQFSNEFTIVMEEFDGYSKNQVFEAAGTYLRTKMNPEVRSFKVSKAEKEKQLSISMLDHEEIVDVFDDIRVKWLQVTKEVKRTVKREDESRDDEAPKKKYKRCYELRFNIRHKDKVLNSYLPYVLNRAKAIKEERRVLQLHTVNSDSGDAWYYEPIDLGHPMSFETLAMDSELKKALLDDLNEFVQGKEFYRKIGKAWKRGYLLYGPPGTGKSSLIAAMANYLNYDIYDLDLTDVYSNAYLRSLLLGVSNRSIIVIEDIDCTIKIQNRDEKEVAECSRRGPKLTLSGILNFIDGLWSCCGEEHVIVFTTNHKDKLDPALLRPGRMDMHIHMSYCTISAFKQLAFNYLGIRNHRLFEQIEGLIEEINVTPAGVAGELMKSTDAEVSLQSLVKFLLDKKTSELHTTETKEELQTTEAKQELQTTEAKEEKKKNKK